MSKWLKTDVGWPRVILVKPGPVGTVRPERQCRNSNITSKASQLAVHSAYTCSLATLLATRCFSLMMSLVIVPQIYCIHSQCSATKTHRSTSHKTQEEISFKFLGVTLLVRESYSAVSSLRLLRKSSEYQVFSYRLQYYLGIRFGLDPVLSCATVSNANARSRKRGNAF